MVTELKDNLGITNYLPSTKMIILDVDHTITEEDEGREFAFRKYGEKTGDCEYANRSKEIIERVKKRAKFCDNGELKKLRAEARVELDELIQQLPEEFLSDPNLYEDILIRDGFEEFMEHYRKDGIVIVGITMATEYLTNHLWEKYKLPCFVCKTDDEKKVAFNQLRVQNGIETEDIICIGDGLQDMLHPCVYKVKMGNFSDFEADVYANNFRELIPESYVELKVAQSSL